MNTLFAAEEASPMNKRALYKQTKEAQLMERLERRMEGESTPDAALCILAALVSTMAVVHQDSPSKGCTFTACYFLTLLQAQLSLVCMLPSDCSTHSGPHVAQVHSMNVAWPAPSLCSNAGARMSNFCGDCFDNICGKQQSSASAVCSNIRATVSRCLGKWLHQPKWQTACTVCPVCVLQATSGL